MSEAPDVLEGTLARADGDSGPMNTTAPRACRWFLADGIMSVIVGTAALAVLLMMNVYEVVFRAGGVLVTLGGLYAGGTLLSNGGCLLIRGFDGHPLDRTVLALSTAFQILGGLLLLLRSLANLGAVRLLLTVSFCVVGSWVTALMLTSRIESPWGLVEGVGTVCLGIALGAQWPLSELPAIVAVVGAYEILVGVCKIGNATAMRGGQPPRESG